MEAQTQAQTKTNQNQKQNKEILEFVKKRFVLKFGNSEKLFKQAIKDFNNIKDFDPNGNIYDTQSSSFLTNESFYCMKLIAQYHLNKVFETLKISLTDPNTKEDLETGNIGTTGRIIKTWSSGDLDDTTEFLSGRWNKSPRLAVFPNNGHKDVVYIKCDLNSVCSHHFIRFGENYNKDNESFVLIGYVPKDKVLGISKINRFVQWVAARAWLQEDLTNYLGKCIQDITKSDDVLVEIKNAQHGCATFRGAKDRSASTSTSYKSGIFVNKDI